jgi:hypothetical protein
VPKSLLRFVNSTFTGNNMKLPLPTPSPSATSKRYAHLREAVILAIVAGGCLLLFAIVATLLIAFCNRDDGMGSSVAAFAKPSDKKGRESPDSKAVIGKAWDGNRMVFLEGHLWHSTCLEKSRNLICHSGPA